MSEPALDAIKRFVAGQITPHEFRDRLYNDDTFETLLTNDPDLASSNYVFSSGRHIILSLLRTTMIRVTCSVPKGACDFMDRNNIEYSKTDQYADLFGLILDVQPEWLYVDSQYVADTMMPHAGGRSGPELQAWLASEFRVRFRYIDSPPKWIQSPAWPIGEKGPLVFLGQLDVNDYFHDNAAAYVSTINNLDAAKRSFRYTDAETPANDTRNNQALNASGRRRRS